MTWNEGNSDAPNSNRWLKGIKANRISKETKHGNR